MGLQGAGGVKNFSVGICDGAPSTARSSFVCGTTVVHYMLGCLCIAWLFNQYDVSADDLSDIIGKIKTLYILICYCLLNVYFGQGIPWLNEMRMIYRPLVQLDCCALQVSKLT